MTTCTQYSIEIGARPYIYRQQQDTAVEYDNEEETLNEVWTLGESTFKALASTSPVSPIWLSSVNDLNFLIQQDFLWETKKEGIFLNIKQNLMHNSKY